MAVSALLKFIFWEKYSGKETEFGQRNYASTKNTAIFLHFFSKRKSQQHLHNL